MASQKGGWRCVCGAFNPDRSGCSRQWCRVCDRKPEMHAKTPRVSKADVCQAELERLRAENERLREAFAALLEEAKDMRSYVPAYFAAKWKHDVALANAQAVLAALGGSQAKGSK